MVTRAVAEAGPFVVIAELSEIEEIRLNSVDPSGNGIAGGDNFEIIGDFSGTSLRLNTITIDGQAGNDTIDISTLSSAHRILFRSNGGQDTIIGTLRAQDVIEVPVGLDPAAFVLSVNEDGTKTLTNDTHSVTFTGDVPILKVAGLSSTDQVGTDTANTPIGTASGKWIDGRGGDDTMSGGGAHDFRVGGAGKDTVRGDGGDDRIVAEASHGKDTHYGDDGSDTLDMTAITSKITIDLGSAATGKSSASSSQSGSDTLWTIENVLTGSGNDTITASKLVNLMDGGGGNDTFRFLSADHANGDTIKGFEPGDKIDLSGIDTNGATKGDGRFVLKAAGAPAVGELTVSYDADHDQTVIEGNAPDGIFRINVDGHHNLTASDFTL